GQLCQPLWVPSSYSYLSILDRSLSDGSHRRVSLAEFSWDGTEMLCGVGTAGANRSSGGAQESWLKSSAGHAVRDLRGLICGAEHSGFCDPAGGDGRAPSFGLAERDRRYSGTGKRCAMAVGAHRFMWATHGCARLIPELTSW